MPIWPYAILAQGPSCFSAAGGGIRMSAQLVAGVVEGGSDEDSSLGWLLLAIISVGVGIGVLLGCLCSRLCTRPAPSHQDRPTQGVAVRWEKIVLHALRFIRRRRRIALAFGNLRERPLRTLPTPPRATNPGRRRRRTAGQVEPLREGPAVSHGTHN